MNRSQAPSSPAKPTDQPAKFWPLDLVLGLLPFTLVAQALVWFIYLPLGLNAYADFRQLYTGGYMIRTGHAGELYDFDAQTKFQQELFPAASKMVLLITHPAFEELVFVPLSMLSYRHAFLLFFAVNIAALVCILKLLWPHIESIWRRWRLAPALIVASFFPISRALLQGQDSILLLLLLTLVVTLLARGKILTAGLCLGLGVFRFQIVLPIAVLLLLWKQFRLVAGFGISAFIAALISLWTVGTRGAAQFVNYMLSLSVRLDSSDAMTKYRDTPLEMLNLRGMVSGLLHDRVPHRWIEATILVLSLLVILIAWRAKPSLALAIAAASLVSYHFIAHDASIWLVPIFVGISGQTKMEGSLATAMLICPFGAAFLFEGVRSHAYLTALPLLVYFLFKSLTQQVDWTGYAVTRRRAGE